MKNLLVKVKDKTRVDELKEYGTVTVMTPYSSIIGFKCADDKVVLLGRHPLVQEIAENESTGAYQN